MNFTTLYDSPLGVMTLASDDGKGLCGLWFEGQKFFGTTIGQATQKQNNLPVFLKTIEWLELYHSGSNPSFLPFLNFCGTDFRISVWKAMLTIPYGTTCSYAQLARKISDEMGGKYISPRAVGNAVAHNPISLLVPCHRVIASDGKLTGYAGGLDKKRFLLELEGCMPKL